MFGSEYDRRLLAAVLGVLLVANPVYLFPGGGHHVQTYAFASEHVDDSLTLALSDVVDSWIVFCDWSPHRACVLERRIGPNGTLTVTDPSTVDAVRRNGELRSSYEYVYLDSGFYEPNATVSNGTVVLTLRPVDAALVADDIARDYEYAPDVIQQAIDEGKASVTYSTPGYLSPSERADHRVRDYQHALVERNGSFYLVRDSMYHSRVAWYAKYLGPIRLVMVFLGLGLVFWAFQYPNDGG